MATQNTSQFDEQYVSSETLISPALSESALRDHARLVTLVCHVGAILAQNSSFPDALQQCAQGLIKYLDAALVRIWTYNPNGHILELQTSEGIYTHLDGAHARIPVGLFKIGKIAEERQPHLTNDLANDSRVSDSKWVSREKLVSFAGFPLLVDGRLVGVLGLFARHPLPGETLSALASISTSIAVGLDRKRAEAELRHSEERFRMTFAAAPLGMVLTTMQGLLTETNGEYRKIVGYTAEELAQTVFLDLGHPEDHKHNRELFQQLLQGDIPSYTIRKRYRCKDGHYAWVRATAALLRDSSGVPRNVIGLVEDISDQKKVEEERERRVNELARSNDELSRFAHVAAHDLKSPLRTITSLIQVIERRLKDRLDDSTAECFHMILKGANRMERLIEGLLHYAGLGRDQQEHLPVVMAEVVTTVTSSLNELITNSGATITSLDLPTVLGDQLQLLQLMQNLIANAIKYRNPSDAPLIQISARMVDTFWEFSVRDNGQGIAPQYQSQVFVLLKRLHGREVPGTGMGLAICQKIVERHGGRIWVESQPGAGSTFFFTLPA
jgi:PAS domain S-box-containing protein